MITCAALEISWLTGSSDTGRGGRTRRGPTAIPSTPTRSTLRRGLLLGFVAGGGGLAFGTGAVVLGAVAASLHVGQNAATWLLAAYFLSIGVATATGGRLIDLIGSRRVVTLAGGATFAGAFSCAAAQSFPMLLAGRLFQGIGAGGLGIVAFNIAGGSRPEVRARVGGTLTAVSLAIVAAGPFIGEVVRQLLSWRVALALPAIVLVALPALMPLLGSPAAEPVDSIDVRGIALATGLGVSVAALLEGPATHSAPMLYVLLGSVAALTGCLLAINVVRRPNGFLPRAVISSGRLLRLALPAAALYAANATIVFSAPLLLAEHFHWTGVEIGLALLPATAAAAGAAFLAGTRGAHRDAPRILAGCSAACTIAMLATALTRGFPPLLVVTSMTTVAGAATAQSLMLDRIPMTFPDAVRGAALGVAFYTFVTGGAVGSAAAGGLAEILGGLPATIGALAVLPAAGAIVLAVISRRPERLAGASGTTPSAPPEGPTRASRIWPGRPLRRAVSSGCIQSMASSQAEYTISVDTGGTFTDLVLADGQQILGLYKAPTTAELFDGLHAALDDAAASCGISTRELLGATRAFVYSTTHATNAIITGKAAKTAFLTTRGNRDILVYREGGKDQPHNLAIPYPRPYVPRRLTFELTERILADGSVAVALDEADVRLALTRLQALEVEAIGVCLLWSVVDPTHELRVGELIEEMLPGIEYSLSHRVNRIVREYRRASATVIDASLKPLMRAHLTEVESRLRELGFRGDPLMVTHVSGGVMRTEQMCERPLQTVDSGPALAPVSAVQYVTAEPEATAADVLVVDAGGTSFDVSIAHHGEVLYTREKWLGPKWYGHMTGLPAVDTRSIGAGGGSIAYVDAGGLLHVGPESAGADPGPAAYGRGGTQPTVTDAAVLLGYLDPANFLGGRIQLDVAAASEVMAAQVAEPLGLELEAAAEAVLRVASEHMRGFITDLTVAQGRDPRRCLIVAGGGAAGLNVIRIARALGVRQVVIPRLAAGLSAAGGQFSNISITLSSSAYSNSRRFDLAGVNATLAELERELDAFLDRVDLPGERRIRFVGEARYEQQIWEIDVDLGELRRFAGEDDVAWFKDRFDEAHANLFAVSQPDAAIEVLVWRGEGRIVRAKPSLAVAHNPPSDLRADRVRVAWFGGQPMSTAVYRVGDIAPGSRLRGPAVIEEPTTTVVLDPGAEAIVRPTHYLVEVGGEAAEERPTDLAGAEARA